LGLDDILPFGRYQGYTVEEILKDRPEYIRWLIVNTSTKFHDSVLTKAAKFTIPKHTQRFYNAEYHFYRDESHNIFSDQDDWFDDVPF
jgi:hypothetical protein